jgi:tripartite-type tricarboxylate transporter receptor subunit TctC
MLKYSRKPLAVAVAFAALAAFGTTGASAQYFKGKTVTVQVPSGSGGTYHVYCQIVERNIARHIPGNPSTVIQNMPGGGGAKSASYMANVAPKNGTFIAMIAPGTITTPLVRKVKFNARKFNWLGAVAARSSAIWFWHTHGVKTLQQIKDKQYTIATSGFSSGGSVMPRLVNILLGTKLKLIYGYKGGGALNLAVERGETQGRWNFRSGFTGVRPTWIPKGKVIPVIAMGPRDPELKGVPHFRDLLKEGSVAQRTYDVLGMNFEVGQAFYVPPGTPKNVVGILKKAFAAMIADPRTKADIIKRGVEFSPNTAAEIEAQIEKGFKAAAPDVVEKLQGVYAKRKKKS